MSRRSWPFCRARTAVRAAILRAEALVADEIPVNACTAGGQSVADAAADVLGVERCEVSDSISARHCGGGRAATRSYDYSGVETCHAVTRVAGGDLECPFGCFSSYFFRLMNIKKIKTLQSSRAFIACL